MSAITVVERPMVRSHAAGALTSAPATAPETPSIPAPVLRSPQSWLNSVSLGSELGALKPSRSAIATAGAASSSRIASFASCPGSTSTSWKLRLPRSPWNSTSASLRASTLSAWSAPVVHSTMTRLLEKTAGGGGGAVGAAGCSWPASAAGARASAARMPPASERRNGDRRGAYKSRLIFFPCERRAFDAEHVGRFHNP